MSEVIAKRHIVHLGTAYARGDVIPEGTPRVNELIANGSAVLKQHENGGTFGARKADSESIPAHDVRALLSGTVRDVLPKLSDAPRDVLERALEAEERITVRRAIEAVLNG